MKWHDLRSFEDGAVVETDLCIVGSGFAGLSIAKEFAETGIEVWIIESSGRAEDAEAQTLNEIESVGAPRVMQQDLMRYRIFGGTSHIWSGQCAPFDEIDFAFRPWVPYSGWMFSRQELDPYLERAGENLGLGPHCYTEALWKRLGTDRPTPTVDPRYLESAFWQASKSHHNAKLPARLGRNFLSDAPNLNILLHANVTHLDTNATGKKLEAIEVTTLEGKRAWVKAKATVLCCGGIENARLLLASNRILPNGVGNSHDTVGRFLMDHPGCAIGHFDPRRSAKVQDRFGQYWLDDERGRHVYKHGLKLSPHVQAEEGLLNCAASLDEYPAADDPWTVMRHLRTRLQNRHAPEDVVARAMFWRDSGEEIKEKSLYQDGLAVVSQSHRIVHGLYRRFVKHRPPILKSRKIHLYCLVEQSPDPNSRVTLAVQKDRLGMPLSRIDWRIGAQEKQTVRRMGQLVKQELRRLRLPELILEDWLIDGADYPFTDRAHPMGTTRMASNPREGVVDLQCRVHGMEGLYIAGSSVFPTAGHANPTLMVTAMAIRLADWLKVSEFRATQPQHISTGSDGGNDRMNVLNR
ncbi:FAD-dependent oxidoreductase [Leptolyngbya ohadii]|uniref:FAD-dependent oxidoreductase n=1 Tax=Leptolyngbya ohadii TaxID=1962290 RepID=UPI000B5A187C|nr:GMC family oxidoreductase [Leptolyngbya ohadii]